MFKMRKLLKVAIGATTALVVLLVLANSEIGRNHVTYFRQPIRGSQRLLQSIGGLNLNSEFDMALFRGISQMQIEQAMAEGKLPPLRPNIKKPEDFSGPSKSVLLFSTWRTGSSFLGDLIASNPGVFYSFEPLHIIDRDSHISDPMKIRESLALMNALLNCQFPQDYLSHINGGMNLSSPVFMSNNRRIWDSCQDKSLCNRTDFVRNLCVNFPVHLIKTVRLRLAQSEKLIRAQVNQNSIKIILLVRDPRGIMASRKHLDWCASPSCADPKQLCRDMDEDLKALKVLRDKYPGTFLLVKHEDLSFHPEESARAIMDFMGMKYSTLVQVFIKTHTKPMGKSNSDKDPYSTVRKSSEVPKEWKKKLTVKEIMNIERSCSQVMDSLNYQPLLL